jgi:hypothetical protein
MQHVTVTTHLTARAADGSTVVATQPETFTLTRNHRLEPWKLLGQPFTLYEICPGESYVLCGHDCNRSVSVSEVQR